MEAEVAAALAARNYRQAARLLKRWHSQAPQDLRPRLYAAHLQAQTNQLAAAEKNYIKLLKQNPNSKLMRQARAGLQRVQQQQAEAKAKAKAEAIAQAKETSTETSILAIAAPTDAHRQQATQAVAEIFSLDAYTARMKVPSTGLRLYRIGPWGELNYYAQQLQQAHMPTRQLKLSDLQAHQTFQICHFEALTPQPTVLCKNAEGQLGKISFDGSEVTRRAIGQLPIFEQVIDIGNWGKLVHKEKVQDYAQVIDLYLPGRKITLRLCDRLYQYQSGIALAEPSELNSRIRWNHLCGQLNTALQGPQNNDFERFGKGALEFIPLLPPLSAHLDIDRRTPSPWDLAFHLYSSLCCLGC